MKISYYLDTKWLREIEKNKLLINLIFIGLAIQFLAFKFLYPYPNFIPPDSDNYIEAAINNASISIWPIGYSKFLQIVSFFSQSHVFIVAIQYIFIQGSLIYLIFTFQHIFNINRWIFRLILFIGVFNPLVIHISNYISSDALFVSLSLIWFSQLMWIIHSPGRLLLILHGVILLFSFTVRFSSIYYPIISISVLLLSNTSKQNKFISILLITLFLGFFIGHTQYEYKIKTGKVQFSPFGGWQLASNALYGYAYAEPISHDSVPNRFFILHKITNRHMDSLRRLQFRPDREVAIYYQWDLKSPLREYMKERWKNDTTNQFLKKWASMGQDYFAYGRFLILKFPRQFLKHYIWPNLLKYYYPPPKFMGYYNMGQNSVNPVVARWFGWKNNSIRSYFNNKQIYITQISSFFFSIINLLFIASTIAFIYTKGHKRIEKMALYALLLMFATWSLNLIFSVFAAPIELRYQIFPMLITQTFVIGILSKIVNKINIIKSKITIQQLHPSNT